MKKTNQKSIQGITLVALVITIIIMLILAGVAINLTIDSNGLFGKANAAGEEWNNSVAVEENEMNDLLGILEQVIPSPDVSGANAPVVPTGVKVQYVTWEEDAEVAGKYNEVLSDTRPLNWHNYINKEWANIKTTSTTANEDGTYNSAYWVWIPRYAYQVQERPTSPSNSGAPTYKIAFLEGTTNNPVDQAVLNGETIKTNTSSGVSEGDWVVHPAFQFGDTPLSGIWVAKYEANSSNPTATLGGGNTENYQVQVLPNTPSWRNITVSTAFAVCQNMTATTGALEGSTSSDPHLMKNVEWGAVVYLAQSEYGKNGQVWNNPYWDDTTKTVLTGKASSEETGADARYTTACDNYNEGNGPEASTTGTVYGIYDMAGGAWEYTAAYVDNSTARTSSNITNLYNAEAKYKDVYKASNTDTGSDAWNETIAQANYEENTDKYGGAIYETSKKGSSITSWQYGYSYFPAGTSFVFYRGGGFASGVAASVFCFCRIGAGGGTDISFRPVCLGM